MTILDNELGAPGIFIPHSALFGGSLIQLAWLRKAALSPRDLPGFFNETSLPDAFGITLSLFLADEDV
jgi:hypothetical protein